MQKKDVESVVATASEDKTTEISMNQKSNNKRFVKDGNIDLKNIKFPVKCVRK